MKSSVVRPLTGLGLVVAIGLIIALAIAMFRGSFAQTVPVTVISERAGLVMNPDAKVKMRGVQVGQVSKIDAKPDGTAELHLAIDKSALNLIPSNVTVDITSSTVFGAKFVQLVPPKDPSPEKLRPGQVIQNKHVMVEVNTVFQQLVEVLDKIEPTKLNQTLGAIATAFNGRGEQIGKTLSDFNKLLGEIEPSLPNLAHDIEASVATLSAYGDASPDLVATMESATRVGNSIVDEQRQLDEFLVSTIGLADASNEVIGANSDGIAEVAHVLVPTTELLYLYRESIRCGVGGLIPFAKSPPQYSGVLVNAGLTLGVERYRYPRDLPKVAASSGGKDYCKELHLPELEPDFIPPALIADIGTNPAQYGNQGILLNSDGLKNWLFGPLAGPPRNTAQIGMPG